MSGRAWTAVGLALAVSGAAAVHAALVAPRDREAAGAPGWQTGRWDAKAFNAAVLESGRKMSLAGWQYRKLQERKDLAIEDIQRYLRVHLGRADPRVVEAFRQVPREYFMYQYAKERSLAEFAYDVPAKPYAIGYGSVISDFIGQAYMTQLADPRPSDRVLEIGTGSGYQATILSRLAAEVWTVEILVPVAEAVDRIFGPLGVANVRARGGDGYNGWPEVRGGFDIIMATCAMPFVPPPLLDQLKPRGRLIVPVGQPFKRGQFLYVFTKDPDGRVRSRRDMGVYFIPMTGRIQKEQAPGL